MANALIDPDADEKHAPKTSGAQAGTRDNLGVHLERREAEVDDLAAPSATKEDAKADDSRTLAAKESNAADSNDGGLYNRHKNKDDEPKKKRWWTKSKAKKAGAGIGTGLLVGGGMYGMTFVSGPLEFLHLAHTLHDSHLSQQENAGDSRMGKLFRYLRSGGHVGATRLGFLGNKYHAKIIGELESIGIEPTYTAGNENFKGFTVDTEHDNSPYKGMSPEDAAKAFEEKTDIKPDIVGTKLSVDADTFWQQRKTIRAMIADLGLSGIVAAARARILGKFAGVSWHPLKRIFGSVDDKIAVAVKGFAKEKYQQYKEKWEARIKNGSNTATVDGSKAKEQGTDKNGNPTTDPAPPTDQTAISDSPKNAAQILGGLKTGLKITGGVAAVAGLVCGLKALDDSIGAIVYAQTILPMIRAGMDAVAVGSQLQSGQDVDPTELQYLSHFFNSAPGVGGHKSATNWTDSAPIRADMHQTGGIDINKGIKDAVKEQKPSWLAWTQSDVVSGLCGTAGTIVTTVSGFVVGVITGGLLTTIAGFVISAGISGPIIDFLAGLFNGDPLNVVKLAGADYGSVVDYGATMGANLAAVASGATELIGGAVGDLNTQIATDQKEDFDSESFLRRTFDLKDYRSLASIVTMKETTSFTANLMSTMQGITGSFADVLNLPFNLYGSTVQAATPGYQYPFPIYGFSLNDLNNSAVADPYANADDVAKMLDSNGQNGTPDFIKKAYDCFGVNISKNNADGVWDVIPDHDINLYDPSTYHPDDCSGLTKVSTVKNTGNTLASANTGTTTTTHGDTVVVKTAATTTTYTQDQNWLKLRFFVLDTGAMEGYTCAMFNDSTSCQNNGNAPEGTNPVSGTGIPSGSAQQLAQLILNNPNITFQQEPQERNLFNEIAQTGHQTACGNPAISPKLLGIILTASQQYKLVLGVVDDGHGCDGGAHPKGLAVDINGVAPVDGSSPGTGNHIDWTAGEQPLMKQFDAYMGKLLGDNGGGGLGQMNCFTSTSPPSVPSNVTFFADSCDHQHVDVMNR